jgi:hypothetical protein
MVVSLEAVLAASIGGFRDWYWGLHNLRNSDRILPTLRLGSRTPHCSRFSDFHDCCRGRYSGKVAVLISEAAVRYETLQVLQGSSSRHRAVLQRMRNCVLKTNTEMTIGSWRIMLPEWFLQVVGVALIGFGVYDSVVYWRLILRNQPTGHAWLRVGVFLVLIFYFSVGSALILFA